MAVYLAAFRDYRGKLSPGEVGVVGVVAGDREQARVVFNYIAGLFEAVPMLAALVAARTKTSITLTNRIVIEVHTASWRSVRGRTFVGVILDEVAVWKTDEQSANPDREILNAIRPGLGSVPGSVLLGISSPYAKRGVLYDMHRKHYGQERDPVLVWQAATLEMNPLFDRQRIEDAFEEDRTAARAEWEAEFRDDLETYVSTEVLDACTIRDRADLPPEPGLPYQAFVDPAGGSGKDSFTLAIAHPRRDGLVVVDCVCEIRPPFSPERAVAELAHVLEQYRVRFVTGDRYAGEWPASRFQSVGVHYIGAERTRSELYLTFLPLLTAQRVELPDNRKLLHQLASLERRTQRSGKDSVDHGRSGHDDLANAVAGVCVLAAARNRQRMDSVAIFG